jgi:integrase
VEVSCLNLHVVFKHSRGGTFWKFPYFGLDDVLSKDTDKITRVACAYNNDKVIFERDRRRFRLHNLRHSLNSWLNKAKIEPKTLQGILRHSRIQTTLDLYTHEDSDETRTRQGNN